MRYIYLLVFLLFAEVSFSQSPTAGFLTSENTLCVGECITITNTSSSNAQSWVWTFQGGTPSSYSGPNPGPVCFNSAGSFTISLTVTNTFGTNTTTQTVSVADIPVVTATLSDSVNGAYVVIDDTTINMFGEAYLWADATPAGGQMVWYPSGVIENGIPVSAGDSLTVTPFYDTYYVVSYTNLGGCTSYDTVFVSVNYEEVVAVPNSFSPNGDGSNDFLRVLTNVDADNNFTNGFVEGGAIAEIDFRVYNRYGILVFRTSDPNEGWDGTFKGKPENPATFVYTLDYRLINGRSSSIKGNVTLFR
jgi:gliding motility-associated-like protein